MNTTHNHRADNGRTDHRPILILGANGTTGRRVAANLAGRPLRHGSRRGVPPFEWNDESTWPGVVDGIGAAYLVYSPDLAAPGATRAVDRFATLAAAGGTERLVLLSGRGEPEAQRAEAAFVAAAELAGAQWTVVRCSWFAQNFSEGFFASMVEAGLIALPHLDIGEPFVDADDIAAVVTAALTEPGHHGRVYELTGPALMTFAQAAAELAVASGRQVEFATVSADEFVLAAVADGMAVEEAEALVDLFDTVLDGRNAQVTDGVHLALDRPARSFADFAAVAYSSREVRR